MTSASEKSPKRINDIILGPFERRALPWMARRLPAWVTPDHLTFLGQYSAVLIGVAYWLTMFSYNWLWVANLGFVLNWVGDSLDGTLARVRKIERHRYGFFVDHYSDTVAVFFMCLGMGVSPIMDLRIALFLMVIYFAMMTLVYIVSLSRDVFKISFAGVGPTEIRIVIMIVNTVVYFTNNPRITIFGNSFTLFDWMGISAAVILFFVYIISAEIERRKLDKLDPPPNRRIDQEIQDGDGNGRKPASVIVPSVKEQPKSAQKK
ncbi:CDP-alcohol phosphatidyltransferase family protein [candidate division KSB1 bacterium]|nr:MAG: CDP-alcohol phosphatidyltransferase family protein [candidate division KSB1 bacterium]RPH96668.1 MAG: CDP-alcohol phosphatidyltransferase family protein [candidate division KSB1 bacterium]